MLYERPMVIDSLNLNLRQILPIHLRLSGNVPPPSRIGMMESEMQDWLHGEDEFPTAFMLWEIYLRLSGNVPPPPPP